jgi:hypothetical protein
MPNPEPLTAKYANYFQIGENALEFMFEFGQHYSGDPAPLIHTRIVTTPAYAQELLHLLQEALQRYEGQFGTLPKSDEPEV